MDGTPTTGGEVDMQEEEKNEKKKNANTPTRRPNS